MHEPLTILGFAGSLRRGSYNARLLRLAQQVAPAEATIAVFDLATIPLYNADVEETGFPTPVTEFRERISTADALLIATPEYNYSLPGVLKNAIDWASRPPDPRPLSGKPAAIMGAAAGPFGTVRAQMHLRTILSGLNVQVLAKPEVRVIRAGTKFDADGNLTDTALRDEVANLVTALVRWTRLLKMAEG